MISMLTGLKASSLPCKCVSNRPEHNAKEILIQFPMELNFEVLQMQRQNIPTDRVWSLDEKNGIICLVIMFTFRVMANKMSKNFVFSANDRKKLVTVWVKYVSVSERCYWVLSENGIVNRLWSYHSCPIECRNIAKTAESTKNTRILYF